MVNANTPAETVIDEPLVRGLLRAQCPVIDGAATEDMPLAPFSNGWDNDIWSLGTKWLVRLPRRGMAAELVVNEQRVLPVLAPRLPLPVPVPVFAGVPTAAYPWHWSVVPRFPGVRAIDAEFADPSAEAGRLARFLRALHVPSHAGAPVNVFRGGPLPGRTESFLVLKSGFPATELGHDYSALEHIWFRAEAGPSWDGPPVWLHGDLHAANIIVVDGRIGAVVDWGDVCSGDPACDLAAGWMLFDEDAREIFFDEYGSTAPGLHDRARAWALLFGMLYHRASEGDPLMARMARAVLDRVLPRV